MKYHLYYNLKDIRRYDVVFKTSTIKPQGLTHWFEDKAPMTIEHEPVLEFSDKLTPYMFTFLLRDLLQDGKLVFCRLAMRSVDLEGDVSFL